MASFAEDCKTLTKTLRKIRNYEEEFPFGNDEKRTQYVKNEDRPDPIVLDMLANAERKRKRGEFDEAALRYYRALELCVERRLWLYGIDNGDVPDASIPPEVIDEFPVHKGQKKRALGLLQSAKLLSYKEDKFGADIFKALANYEIDTEARNHNWLIHGERHVCEKNIIKVRAGIFEALNLQESDMTAWATFYLP